MEEDINIYEDLSNFDLVKSDINDQPKTNHACNCEEVKKKLNSLKRDFEDIKKVNENLEKNIASLLKTAKAEITRKDKVIEELRNQLDNTVFRRNKYGSLEFSTLRLSYHNTMAEKHESITPLMNTEENTFMSQQIEPSYTEYKGRKPQNNIDQVPVTVFGERLHKRIMDDKKEEKRLKSLSKLDSETNVNKVTEECVVESDKENGSQSSVINTTNESNTVTRTSNSDISYKKNLGKRLNEEDDICKSKHLKTENNENKNDNIDCNSIAQYDIKDNFMKLRDQLCTVYSVKKEQTQVETKRRATSEYGDTKQAYNCKSRWEKEKRTSATKDYDNARTRKEIVDSSRSQTVSISNERLNSDHQQDHYINSHRKNDYRRGSSSSRSSFKNRNDYESSSGYRLWEKSSREYRGRKYDDYKYDSRYKNDRSRRDYDKETGDFRTRYSNRERADSRNRSRHTMSDVEERRSRSGSYKSNKYDNDRLKETAANVSEDKRLHKDSKTMEFDSQESSSRTIVNTIVDHSIEKNIERNAKDELRALASSTENTSTCVIIEDKSHLEEGEILDSPEKKNDVTKISTTQAIEENLVEASTQVKDANEPMDIIENVENMSHCIKKDVTQLNLDGEYILTTAKTCLHNIMINDLHSDKIVTYPSCPSSGVIVGCNNNSDDYEGENCVNEYVKNDIVNHPVERIDDSNNGNIRSEEVGNVDVEDTTVVDKVVTMLSLANKSLLSNDNEIYLTDQEDVGNSISSGVMHVKTVSITCDNVDKSQISNGNETSYQIPNNSNTEASRTCLGDHNYVRDTAIDASNLDAVPNTLECREFVSDIEVILKETEGEKTVNQSVDTKKITSTTVKSKKDQNSKAVVISRRRKAVTLSDNNASMTVLINMDAAKSSHGTDNSANDKSDTVSKPRACKLARTTKPSCK